MARTPGGAWLDGGAHGWSILVWDPAEVVTASDDWPAAAAALSRPRAADDDLPFVSGVLGYVGYEAGHATAPVPRGEDAWEPRVHLGRYRGALLHHGPTGAWHAVGDADVRDAGTSLLHAAHALPAPRPAATTLATTVPRAAFVDAVRAALERIAGGDVYQLNLSRPVFAQGVDDAWEAWRRLRERSVPERAAFLTTLTGEHVLSHSPERLLDVRGDAVTTLPIKGTRPRHPDPARDAALAAELLASDKELAELTMIVDLCRNDLGRVAAPGTVSVGTREITSHANVHHAAWPVRARLDAGRDAWDALTALFPPGSVTGAPKVRACQRIHELEPHPRGVYCGALGFVSDHGRASWSVAIRTAVVRGTEARYHVGAGIVADSDPEAEWEETVAKGTLLAEALGVAPTGDAV